MLHKSRMTPHLSFELIFVQHWGKPFEEPNMAFPEGQTAGHSFVLAVAISKSPCSNLSSFAMDLWRSLVTCFENCLPNFRLRRTCLNVL